MEETDVKTNWDKAAKGAVFTHPLDEAGFRGLVPSGALILDIGCGYGRTVKALRGLGYERVTGLDISPEMVARGCREFPDLDLRVLNGDTLPFRDNTAGAVILFAVLTCIPGDREQKRLMAEILRVLSPEGLLYVSDYPLQTDVRNRDRYAITRPQGMPFGVFQLPDGETFRHHSREWMEELFMNFEMVSQKEIPVVTFKGNRSTAFQAFLKKPAS